MGTWWDNTYPDAECDVPAHLYSYSFDRYSGWSQAYAQQKEIQEYLLRFAEKFNLLPHIRLNTALVKARFDAQQGLWLLQLANGDRLRADFLVCSAGSLSTPRYPDIQGIDMFKGRLFHSARWDDDCDFAGKHAAVIDTAASAVQLIPRIAPLVAKLYICQRSPAWIVPKINHAYSRWRKALLRVNLFARVHRFLHYGIHELNRLAFNPGSLMAKAGRT